MIIIICLLIIFTCFIAGYLMAELDLYLSKRIPSHTFFFDLTLSISLIIYLWIIVFQAF